MAQPKDFGFGQDEVLLRDSARRLLDETAPVEKVRRLVAASHVEAYESDPQPARFDEGTWRKMIDLGWTSLAVPEEAGGAGVKCAAIAAIAEEIGRHAVPTPLEATIFTTLVLREAKTPAARECLGRIASGTAATLAVTDSTGSWEGTRTAVRGVRRGRAFVLDGTASFVQDARKAALFVVSAAVEGEIGLFVVPSDHPGVAIGPDRIVDLTRDQARVSFSGVEVSPQAVVAPPPAGVAALERATPAILTILAADMAGAAEWQLQTTAEYAKVRRQFDHPIGFFQAVKHPIVNMMVAVDETRSLVYNAACAIDTEPETALRYARMAKSSASDTAAFCSGRSVQLHGGIGFTWECDVHIWFKRQLHSQMLFGDGVYQREKLAALM